MSHTQIAQGLLRLVGDGGTDNRLLVQAPRGYVLFCGQRGEPNITIEVSAGHAIDEPLSVEQQQQLWTADYRRGRASENFSRLHEFANREEAGALASEALSWIKALFNTQTVAVDLVLGELETTSNPAVIQAMLALAKDRDLALRKTLWHTLVRANLLLPLRRAAKAGEPLALRSFGQLGGGEVAGVFTDATAMRGHDPRPRPYTSIGGRALFTLLAERSVASLKLLAPKGLRGELYRHEIQSVAEAVAQRG